MGTTTGIRLASVATLCTLLAGARVAAAQDFQQFLFDACTAPTGQLAARCGETSAGTGDVSAASEASLNPSQLLAGNDGSHASNYGRGEETRGAGGVDELRASTTAMELGPFGLSLSVRWLDERLGDGGSTRPHDLIKKSAQLGVDYRWSRRFVTGLWVGLEDTGLTFATGAAGALADAGQIDTRGVGGALFASFSSEQGHSFDLGLGFTGNDHDIERRAVFEPVNPLVPDPAITLVDTRAESTGEDRWLSANWSRSFENPGWSIAPFAGLTWAESTLDAYDEQDLTQSGLAMRSDGLRTRSLSASAGFDASRVHSTDFAVLVPRIRVGYNWEFESDAAAANSRFLLDASDNVLVVRGQEPDRDSLELGAGVVAVFPRGWTLYFDARTTIGLLNRDRYVVALGWRVEL